MVPFRPWAAISSLMATAASAEAEPRRLCPQPWPGAPATTGTLKPDFPLNKPENQGAQILVTGDNFGCGSSREHAPWALVQNGIRAVVSTSFADIFKGNAVKNGLLPVVVPADFHKQLLNSPGAKVTIDLAGQKISVAGGPSAEFPVESFAKRCMLDGVDELGYMLNQDAAIAAFEAKHPTLINTLA